MPSTITEVRQRTEDTFRAFADYARIETFVSTKEALLSNAEKDLKIKSKGYKDTMQILRQKLKDGQAEFSKVKEICVSAEKLESM